MNKNYIPPYNNRGKIELHKFPGRKATIITKYVNAHLEDKDTQCPNTVILVAGGNDLHRTKRTPTRELSNIAQSIIGDAVEWRYKYNTPNVCNSSILHRPNCLFPVSRHELNGMLRSLCQQHDFDFIENDNFVAKDHLQDDGIHLNDQGTQLLEDNIVEALNNST